MTRSSLTWVMFRVLDEHGRDALGAELTMIVGTKSIRRDVRAAYSYLASNDPRVHVGLGKETAVRDVSVRWPDGRRERVRRRRAGQDRRPSPRLRASDVGATITTINAKPARPAEKTTATKNRLLDPPDPRDHRSSRLHDACRCVDLHVLDRLRRPVRPSDAHLVDVRAGTEADRHRQLGLGDAQEKLEDEVRNARGPSLLL